MSDFEQKRIKYLIKACRENTYVQMGQGDITWLQEALIRAESKQTYEMLNEQFDKALKEIGKTNLNEKV